jgi:diadenosine tetraphosphatase ApaH/serine/threonine PP2A family protein phosphatase
VKDTIPDAVVSYLEVLDELLAARARGPLDDETEARFSTLMNDWRAVMTTSQEAELEPLIAERLKSA